MKNCTCYQAVKETTKVNNFTAACDQCNGCESSPLYEYEKCGGCDIRKKCDVFLNPQQYLYDDS